MKLSGKRRIVVQEFKGNWFVNLREYYEDKSGEMRPGKKVGENNPRYLRFRRRVMYAYRHVGHHALS